MRRRLASSQGALVLLAMVVLETVRLPALAAPLSGVVELLLAVAFTIRVRGGLSLLGFLALPLIYESIARGIGFGSPPEFVLLAVIRNLMLAVHCAPPTDKQPRHVPALLSLFIVLAAIGFARHWAVAIGGVAYAVAGLAWLMEQSWQRLDGRFVLRTRSQPPRPRRLGPLATVLGLTGCAAFIGLGGLTTTAVSGLFYSSGGDSWHDTFADGGVRDGDMLVGATHEAESFGPVESDLFMTDESPSLYDVATDMYGDPCPKRKRSETTHAIALGQENVLYTEEHKSQTQQSGREFSTVRRRHRPPPKLPDRKSDALVFVQGRVPLHLRLETFDAFDGRNWRREQPEPELLGLKMQNTRGQPWVAIDRGSQSTWLTNPELHRLKVIRLDTPRVPTPGHLTGVRIDMLERTDIFGWTRDDVLHMPHHKQVPALQVIHFESRVVGHGAGNGEASLTPTKKPASPPPAYLRELAERWTAGSEPGWPQVEAIVARLRADYTLDSDYHVPEDNDDSVREFLCVSRRGPDYLFASAATLLIRSLGHSARTALGLYANPTRYERLGDQTPVFAHDIHFWTEVQVDRHTWCTVDATPGYEVLSPPQTIWASASIAIGKAAEWCVRHPATVGGIVFALALAFVFRRRLLDRAVWLVWFVAQCVLPARRVEWTLRLLETRDWLAGRPRPRGVTLKRWYGRAELAQFVELAMATLYQPTSPCLTRLNPAQRAAATNLCWNVARLPFRDAHPEATP